MAIKVISVDPSVYKRCTCKNCGSVLEYLPSDVERGSYGSYDGSSEYYNYIACPSCHNKVLVPMYGNY